MTGKKIRVKAPATVSNLSCGFDVIGLALGEPYDIVELELTETGSIEIEEIRGCETLSRDPGKNVVGAVLKAVAAAAGGLTGFRAVLEKGIRPGSGIGSSGASAAAAAYAAGRLLDDRFSLNDLVRFAMEGERLVSGSPHADNAAPSLLGGITLIRSYDPLDIVQLHIPRELWCVIIHPEAEIRTSVARGLLDTHIPLGTAVRQWGNLAGLVAGLYREDYELIGRSLVDFVAEPKRAGLISGFCDLKEAALKNGALGAGISGSGPSVFALCRGRDTAAEVMKGMSDTMVSLGTAFDAYMSPVSRKGAEEW
ncbi:MAG: homoserine kinase [Bacteroidales bacterium]|jgi:homoserine kinase|nr:homoserine kinase [Bacteroidales bacterium]